MNKIRVLKNPVQEYAWGSKTVIQPFLGESGSRYKRIAELWLGAHPLNPSSVLINKNWEPLDQFISRDPELILGKGVSDKFFCRLPFLFKVLAADKPLSIQVHPDLEQARKGFEQENRTGVSVNASNRNYRDSNRKPEILFALTPFVALKGFRKVEEIIQLMDKAFYPVISTEIAQLKKMPDASGLKRFYSSIMTMDRSRKELLVSKAAGIDENQAAADPAFSWMIKLSREYPGDTGMVSPLIFNLLHLKPGEAIFLNAGEPHAYLHGAGIELMGNSDNVLRGGLTFKHIDVMEFLKITNFNPEPVSLISPQRRSDSEMVFLTPAEEFELSMIMVDDGSPFQSDLNRSVELMICMEGKADIIDMRSAEYFALKKGNSVIIPSAVTGYRIKGNATLYKASVPLSS